MSGPKAVDNVDLTVLGGRLAGHAAAGPLDRHALVELANEIGRDEALWRPFEHYDGNERQYVRLHEHRDLEVWLICWSTHQGTGLHDHDGSAGGVYVCEGELVEDLLEYRRDGMILLRSHVRSAGTGFDFGRDHIHAVSNLGLARAASIHVYSPAIRRMGRYEWGVDGVLRREPMDVLAA